MKKTIFILSLIFSLSGIFLSFLFVFFDPRNSPEFLNFIGASFKPYHYSGLDIYIVTERSERSSSSVSVTLVNLFFYLSFLAGSIIYYFSKYKETKLLLFNYSLIFLGSIISAICFFNLKVIRINILAITYILLMNTIHVFISYYFITKYLNPETLDNENLENTSKSKRFLNLLIDSLIIISIAFGLVIYAEVNEHLRSFFNYLKTIFGDKSGAFAFFSLIKFFYYLSFESIFNSTPAKFLTACYITDEDGNRPSFSMILKRTLLRFVPFESLSFLMGKNLHDDYSDTFVVNKTTDIKREKIYFKVLSACFVVMLVIYFYDLSVRGHF